MMILRIRVVNFLEWFSRIGFEAALLRKVFLNIWSLSSVLKELPTSVSRIDYLVWNELKNFFRSHEMQKSWNWPGGAR